MHYTNRRFWECYDALPEAVQRTADQGYELLKIDPSHPSLLTPAYRPRQRR